jgi:peptidoglycan-N-acetylglucosamine deacetylase
MNILTFDIEEWFHILDNNSTKTEKEWSNYESRIHKNMDIIFDIIDNKKINPTFFVVGWIAEKYPKLVKKIAEKGIEIGSHTHLHQLVYENDKKTFFNDVEKSIKTLEDCSGKKVRCFRAPGFSITEKNKWAFEVLYELGIEIDSSVFPANRSHGGFSSYTSRSPSIISYNGATLKEFPINYYSFFNARMIFSGGGYFRLIPYNTIKKLTEKSNYIMSYFHPRDFDFNQPVIKDLSSFRKFKSYVGLKNCKFKLEKWLDDFEFINIDNANSLIDWKKTKIIKL